MKFKIRKEQVDVLSSIFKKESHMVQEIDLELVLETATEAIVHQQVQIKAYHEGWHRGFKEGLYEGRKPETWRCKCGCGGNNCFNRLCDDKCWMFNN